MENKVEIFRTAENQTEIRVHFDKESVWLNQEQLSILFKRDRTVIGRHIRNIFQEGELDEPVVCADFAHTTQHGAMKDKTQTKATKYYNLDVIISVGYRVKSQQGTRFRQWATVRLKDYLVQGYAINEKRLEQKNLEIETLKTGIRIINRAMEREMDADSSAMLKMFSKGMELLDDYDHEKLDIRGNSRQEVQYPEVKDYLSLINAMQSDFQSAVFAKPKDESFDSSVNQIRQHFSGKELYPTVEEKAANLLYFITKNHSYVDGNKRIAAACFLYFLQQNNFLLNKKKEQIISNEALATLTLLIATSKSEESETVKRIIISILNRNNT